MLFELSTLQLVLRLCGGGVKGAMPFLRKENVVDDTVHRLPMDRTVHVDLFGTFYSKIIGLISEKKIHLIPHVIETAFGYLPKENIVLVVDGAPTKEKALAH